MNLRPILPICFLIASLPLAACTGSTSSQQATPRRGFITATFVPPSATAPPTATTSPSETSEALPDADTPSPPASATTEPTGTATFLPTASPSPLPPTRRPVVVVPPTPVVIDVDLSALLAQDASGAQKDPAAFALSFLPDQRVLHAVAKFANVPAGTKVKAAWTAVDLAGALPPNTKLGETEFAAGGMPNLDFQIPTTLGAFLPGKYKVEIWLNDRLDTILNFSATAPPDVYVTALQVQPGDPRGGQPVAFVATFLNTTGEPKSYDWLVLIFRSGQTKPFGESAHRGITVSPGTAKFTAEGWKTGRVMECESFVAQAHFRDSDKNKYPFKSLKGDVVSTGFSVCP